MSGYISETMRDTHIIAIEN